MNTLSETKILDFILLSKTTSVPNLFTWESLPSRGSPTNILPWYIIIIFFALIYQFLLLTDRIVDSGNENELGGKQMTYA